MTWMLTLFGALFGGCAGNGDTGGETRQTCGPDAACETEGLLCDISQGRCVECLSTASCMDESQACIDGSCEDRLCIEDSECLSGRCVVLLCV